MKIRSHFITKLLQKTKMKFQKVDIPVLFLPLYVPAWVWLLLKYSYDTNITTDRLCENTDTPFKTLFLNYLVYVSAFTFHFYLDTNHCTGSNSHLPHIYHHMFYLRDHILCGLCTRISRSRLDRLQSLKVLYYIEKRI